MRTPHHAIPYHASLPFPSLPFPSLPFPSATGVPMSCLRVWPRLPTGLVHAAHAYTHIPDACLLAHLLALCRRRILIGDDAHRLDQAVRAAPEEVRKRKDPRPCCFRMHASL